MSASIDAALEVMRAGGRAVVVMLDVPAKMVLWSEVGALLRPDEHAYYDEHHEKVGRKGGGVIYFRTLRSAQSGGLEDLAPAKIFFDRTAMNVLLAQFAEGGADGVVWC